MHEPGEWVEPRVITTGCCEGLRWQLRLTGPDNTRSQARLAGLAENPAAAADVLLALARDGGRLPRLVLAERLYRDSSFSDQYPDVAAALVTAATETRDPHLLERLIFGADFPPEAVAALAVCPDHRVRAGVPLMAACPPQMLAVLAEDPHPDVRLGVAVACGGTKTDREVLIKLARDPDPMVRETVGDRIERCQDLPDEAVEILARDPIATVRASVIERADDSLAEDLAADPDPRVRVPAAGRGRLSAESMVMLAADENARVRRALSWSENVSGPVLTILAADPDPEVRRAVAFHAATPREVRIALAADPSDQVAMTAVAGFTSDTCRQLPTLEHLEASADRFSVGQLRDLLGAEIWLGCNPGPRPWPVEEAEDTRLTLLAQCAVSRFARLRALAAADRRLPPEIAAVLADDRDPMVRRWLAKHCRHRGILSRLAENPARGVGDALARNSATPPEVLERLPARPHRLARHWNAPGALLARLLDGADHVTRTAVAGHPNTPPEVLAELARGTAERDVIRAACAHPALPVSVMTGLLERAHVGVPQRVAPEGRRQEAVDDEAAPGS